MTLRNFGGVLEKTIEFGPNVTVVAGPNEVGKSSFQSALRLLFHYLDNSTPTPVRGVVPTDKDSIGPGAKGRIQIIPSPFRLKRVGPYDDRAVAVILGSRTTGLGPRIGLLVRRNSILQVEHDGIDRQ